MINRQRSRDTQESEKMSKIELLSNRKLHEVFEGGEGWWERQRPKMEKAGVISKRGRKFWGSLEDVARWLHSGKKVGRRELSEG